MEMNNRELEELIDILGQRIMEDETHPRILNPFRMAQVFYAHTVLEKMTEGTGIKVSAALHEPFNSMGSICMEGDTLEFSNCQWLGSAIVFSDNMEIFPLVDGKIKMVLTFHGLTSSAETK